MFADNELFVPTAERVSMALAGGLGAIVAVKRANLSAIRRSVLFVRWRTWALTAPLFGAAVMGPRWFGVLFVSVLGWQGVREFAHAADLPRSHRVGLYGAAIACAPVAALSLTTWRAMPPVLIVLATLPVLAAQDTREGLRNLAYSALAFVYVPYLLTYLLLLRDHIAGGPGVLLALGVAVALSDVAAFVAGSAFGRHAFAPRLSPNKTWEGVAGNLAGAVAGIALMSFALPHHMSLTIKVLLPVLVAAGAVWGDLFESLIKRTFGVKDTGAWLPGFGGILDRIDSLLVVLPLTYTVLVVWGR